MTNWKVFLLGLASWVAPFLVSFLFYGPAAVLALLIPHFKSPMVVISGGLGAALLVLAFQTVRPTFWSGLQIGLYWLAINLVLDLIFLLPITGHSFIAYLGDIGLRYLLIPIMAVAMGIVAERPRERSC